jgi:hypothetical protein
MSEPVPPVRRQSRAEALAELYRDHRRALLRGEEWTGETHNRTAMQQGLACILIALREDLPRSGQTIGSCAEMALHDLAMALLDLAEGRSPALLEPGEQHAFDRSERSPESDGHAIRNLKHVVLGAVQILLCRTDVNKGEAREIVARALTNAGVRPRKRAYGAGAISRETVRKWEAAARHLPMGRPMARIPSDLQLSIWTEAIGLDEAERELTRIFEKLAVPSIR